MLDLIMLYAVAEDTFGFALELNSRKTGAFHRRLQGFKPKYFKVLISRNTVYAGTTILRILI